jgi:hypothetical protein
MSLQSGYTVEAWPERQNMSDLEDGPPPSTKSNVLLLQTTFGFTLKSKLRIPSEYLQNNLIDLNHICIHCYFG